MNWVTWTAFILWATTAVWLFLAWTGDDNDYRFCIGMTYISMIGAWGFTIASFFV